MSSEYFTRTSLYLVRLKSLNGLNFLEDVHLHQVQGNWAGRNFVTESHVNSQLITLRMQECRDESEIYNYQRIQLSNNKFINEILGGTLDPAWLELDQIKPMRWIWKIANFNS